MKLCPLCHLCYEEAETSCANDQSPLVSTHPDTRLVAKKYRLDWLLGRGRLGALYEGTHIATDRCVAVRLLAPDRAGGRETPKQFRAEAHTVAHLNTRIDHQHVAKTCDYGTLTDGTPYIVTELLTCTPLREFMAGAGALTVSDAVRVARQMADGLEAAHRCGVVHGDLNPSNVFVTQDRRGRLDVKILDFGFGRLRALLMTGDDGGRQDESPATSPYLPPEQKLGRRLDERSDLYGLGMILYELLAGRPHLLQATQVCEGAGPEGLTPLTELREDVPEPLWRLVEQSVATKPSARPANAGEFKRRLMGLGGPGPCERSVDFVPDVQVATPQEGGAMHPARPLVHAAEL
ncbi:MAG TPA: serine/threonine-protein kinase, partial [Pyrinomonadaceae bacterium]|nr:serine/threonine-protein kinase [Pyrinomonadaceae bacterium]